MTPFCFLKDIQFSAEKEASLSLFHLSKSENKSDCYDDTPNAFDGSLLSSSNSLKGEVIQK